MKKWKTTKKNEKNGRRPKKKKKVKKEDNLNKMEDKPFNQIQPISINIQIIINTIYSVQL
jgi:hypothetical protein